MDPADRESISTRLFQIVPGTVYSSALVKLTLWRKSAFDMFVSKTTS